MRVDEESTNRKEKGGLGKRKRRGMRKREENG